MLSLPPHGLSFRVSNLTRFSLPRCDVSSLGFQIAPTLLRVPPPAHGNSTTGVNLQQTPPSAPEVVNRANGDITRGSLPGPNLLSPIVSISEVEIMAELELLRSNYTESQIHSRSPIFFVCVWVLSSTTLVQTEENVSCDFGWLWVLLHLLAKQRRLVPISTDPWGVVCCGSGRDQTLSSIPMELAPKRCR